MGRRGPAPKGEYPGKSKVLSTRIRPDLRAALDAASKESGRSLSQEIEHRLRRTFTEDERIADLFGSRTNYYIMRAIDLAIQTFVMKEGPKAEWIHDQGTFDRVCKTIGVVLDAIRPPGSTPKGNRNFISDLAKDRASKELAALVWNAIQNADPSTPLLKGSIQDHRLALLKSELGEIAMRPELAFNVAGDPRFRDYEFERETYWVSLFRQYLGKRETVPQYKKQFDIWRKQHPREWDLAVEAGPMAVPTRRKRIRRKT